jgi:hypothetical protein
LKIEWNTFFKPRRVLKRNFPTGTILFTGHQGAGKSLSASHYLYKLKQRYPNLYIYSNIKLAIADKILTSEQIADYILDVRDDGAPIAFFIDEIQTVLFQSKKAVSFETFKAICQQRKTQKTIIGTMQEFLDLDITYRRQLQSQVQTFNWGAFQIELWRDPETLVYDAKKNDYIGKTKDVVLWKRHNEAYDLYDTFEIVGATMKIDVKAQQAARKTPLPLKEGK